MNKLVFILISFTLSLNAWSNSGAIRGWGDNIVRETGSLGVTFVAAGFSVAGLLMIVGSQFGAILAQQVMKGAFFIFGCSSIAALFLAIFR